MLGMLKYPDDCSKAQGLNQLWYKDTATMAVLADNTGIAIRHSYLISSPTVMGTFSYSIPLKHIFGFCDDYDKIVYGLKHTLSRVRKTDNAMFIDAAADVSKVTIDKISWFVPRHIHTDSENFPFIRLLNQRLNYQKNTELGNGICFQFLSEQVSLGD